MPLQAILILDPPEHSVDDLRCAFEAKKPRACAVEVLHRGDKLLERVSEIDTHWLVVVHVERGDGKRSGLELIEQIRGATTDLPVVAVSDHGDVDSASRAIQAGASDFLVRGPQLELRVDILLAKMRGLLHAVQRARTLDAQNAELQHTIQAQFRIVGESPQVKELIARIHSAASVPRPLLITGERGTGKELVARAIHFAAKSESRSIVTVNCAAFSDALLESELFGHEKGAFTGADETRLGKFEQADGGTLFLDEIGHMSKPFQQKILRVVEYGSYSRVGGHGELTTSTRIIAATNVNLKQRIRDGKFLSDLYDRLAFDVIQVPSLREREGDVEVLARHFLNQFAREIPTFRGKTLARSALRVLRDYPFPGNVRELKNIIERAAYRDTTNEITPEDIGMLSEDTFELREGTFQERVNAFRRHLINGALKKADGNQAQAARSLGLSYHQFRYYFGKLSRK